jgi:hypothetical protein
MKPVTAAQQMELDKVVGQYVYPTGIVYADRTRDDPATKDYKRLAYLNYATLKLDLEPDLEGDLLDWLCLKKPVIGGLIGHLAFLPIILLSQDFVEPSGLAVGMITLRRYSRHQLSLLVESDEYRFQQSVR